MFSLGPPFPKSTGEDQGKSFLIDESFEFREQFLGNPATYTLQRHNLESKELYFVPQVSQNVNWSRDKQKRNALQYLPFLDIGRSDSSPRRL